MKIKVAIIGVGSCAKSLVQGVQFYTNEPDYPAGLNYKNIGGYKASNIQFVLGVDIDERKVGDWLGSAIYASPNCSMDFGNEILYDTVPLNAEVIQGPRMDGVSAHMLEYHKDITFKPMEQLESDDKLIENFRDKLDEFNVDVVINYLPVGSEEASKVYLETAIKAGCNVINCMPSFISQDEATALEKLAVKHKVTIVGSDMKSQFGASRLSEILQASLMDSGLLVTQHIQENKACGSTQGQEHIMTGRTANTDFLNMANKDRLKNKHISKENVLKACSTIRDESIEGTTLYAGPSLTVEQKPGGTYIGSDNKVANIDIVAYGFGGARYELTARLSVQDSPNSGGVVIDAIRFCKTAQEMKIFGYLRGASAYTQKTPPWQMNADVAKFECDELAARRYTDLTNSQFDIDETDVEWLPFTSQSNKSDYD